MFFLPVPVALATLAAGLWLVPRDARSVHVSRSFDLAGAVTLTAAMLLLVFTVVEAPDVGWGSPRTIGSFAAVAAILAAFVAIERRAAVPLVRLGILRSAPLVQANLAAMMLIGGWFGFQFIATLYMQQLRGWSPLETGLAIFPGGLPRRPPCAEDRAARDALRHQAVDHGRAGFDRDRLRALPADRSSTRRYVTAILPTMIFAGFGFALAYGPLNIAATNGVAANEQGLASGLVSTSFQFGGALVLAVVTAVNNANTVADGSAQGLLDGFQAAVVVSVIAATLGVLVSALPLGRRTEPATEVEPHLDAEDAEAA